MTANQENIYASLDPFLAALSSAAPTPGGGAVAGLCGSLAAALSHMVASLTVGKKKYAEVTPIFEGAMPKMQAAQQRFRELMEEDVTAFQGYMAALALPKSSAEEKTQRQAAIKTATIAAAETPMQTLELCGELIPLIDLAAKSGNSHAVSDAGMAALLIVCAAKSAALNVRINLLGLRDGEEKQALAARLEQALEPTIRAATSIEQFVDAGLR